MVTISTSTASCIHAFTPAILFIRFFFLILTPCLKSAELRSFQSLLFLYNESSIFSLGVHTKTVHVLYISYNTIIMFHKDLLWSFSCMLGPTRVVQWKSSLGNWIFFFNLMALPLYLSARLTLHLSYVASISIKGSWAEIVMWPIMSVTP